jgi:hypothetical protein
VKRIAVEIIEGDAGDRSAALSALNILGHSSLIPVVIPFIEGKVTLDEIEHKTICEFEGFFVQISLVFE